MGAFGWVGWVICALPGLVWALVWLNGRGDIARRDPGYSRAFGIALPFFIGLGVFVMVVLLGDPQSLNAFEKLGIALALLMMTAGPVVGYVLARRATPAARR